MEQVLQLLYFIQLRSTINKLLFITIYFLLISSFSLAAARAVHRPGLRSIPRPFAKPTFMRLVNGWRRTERLERQFLQHTIQQQPPDLRFGNLPCTTAAHQHISTPSSSTPSTSTTISDAGRTVSAAFIFRTPHTKVRTTTGAWYTPNAAIQLCGRERCSVCRL